MSGATLLAASVGEFISATDHVLSDLALSPGTAWSGYRLTTTGDEQELDPAISDIGDWLTPKGGAPSTWHVNATLNSGGPLTAGSSATGSDIALTSVRDWNIEQVGVGVKTADLTIAFKRGSGGPTAKSINVTLRAEVTL